ncbi:hypothetical protein EBBID32_40270 [Sphingobium indicum BiD32]|uniref:Uncharacterized protein n=1 Tax=Sphingobium indicum BiD32 TaxID=1301087 RepID=N1MWL5_9SPHN|nr:hypothetical protein EBBID32_40270 [Sphingobium indicum BiD32]
MGNRKPHRSDTFPRQIYLEDMHELEAGCIEFIAGFHMRPYLRARGGPMRGNLD